MSRTLAITNTAGTDNIIIAPGQLNGFAGSNNDTDLRLYGVGTQQWGEGVNENLYRILENFACPPKELNDHNPVSSNNDYDPSTQDILPKDANDLGPGRGINNPTTGQIWFNTETSSLYVFDQDVGWRRLTGSVPASATSPVTPNLGDLWYDTNAAQLKTWNGSNWISVADQYLPLDGTSAMSGTLDLDSNKIVNLTDPDTAQDAATKNYVDTQIGIVAGGGAGAYVQITGSTMTGILNLDTTSGSRLNVSYNSSTLTIGNGGNITTGSDIRKTGNMLVTADGGMYMHFATGSTFRVARGGANRNSGFNDLLTVTNSGVVNVIPGYETLGLSNTSLINKAYFDVNKTSQLNQLNDVQTSPSDGDVLRYNGGANRWEQGAGANFGFPAGVIVPYGGGTEPTGWLQCDGSPVSRTTYSDLFNNIGTNYGAGDGSTTFNLPDFRGEFLRGWDDGRGVDTGRNLGSFQSYAMENITGHIEGGLSFWSNNGTRGAIRVTTGGNRHTGGTSGGKQFDFDASRVVNTSNETRPRNVTVNYIIKT